MNAKDLLRHHRSDTPCYSFSLLQQPNLGDHKQQYIQAVRAEAQKIIQQPILVSDVEVEIIYSTSISAGSRADVDNIIKPTLDALVGVAFQDDKQVRSVTSTLFDKNEPSIVDGRVELFQPLFYTRDPHVLLVSIYSDSRLKELGGEEVVRKKRMEDYLQRFPTMKPKSRKWWKIWFH